MYSYSHCPTPPPPSIPCVNPYSATAGAGSRQRKARHPGLISFPPYVPLSTPIRLVAGVTRLRPSHTTDKLTVLLSISLRTVDFCLKSVILVVTSERVAPAVCLSVSPTLALALSLCGSSIRLSFQVLFF